MYSIVNLSWLNNDDSEIEIFFFKLKTNERVTLNENFI